MYTKRQMLGVGATIAAAMMASILIRQWASRHATHDDWTAVPADAIQATF